MSGFTMQRGVVKDVHDLVGVADVLQVLRPLSCNHAFDEEDAATTMSLLCSLVLFCKPSPAHCLGSMALPSVGSHAAVRNAGHTSSCDAYRQH